MKIKAFGEITSKTLRTLCAFSLTLGLAAPLSLAVAEEAEADTAFAKQVVGTQTDNIEVHLFNYGNQVNSLGNLHFCSENTTYELDGIRNPSCSYYQQAMATMGDLTDGAPYVSRWYGVNAGTSYCAHTGSWKYLFDTSSTATSAPTTSNYGVAHYEVDNLSLFTFDGDTGYYSYDSRYNAAEYDYETKTLSAFNYALRQTSVANRVCNQGAFLPFNQVSEDFSNVGRLTNEDGSKASNPGNGIKSLQNGNNGTYGYFWNGASIENWTDYGPADLYLTNNDTVKTVTRSGSQITLYPRASNLFALNNTEKADLGFGMSVDFDFYMPEDGKVKDADGNLTDMVYEFSGDDDLVVYIDGKPVLNIAGHHEAIKGTINFATGVVTIYEDGKTWEQSNYRSGSLKLDKDMSHGDLFGSDWKTSEFATGTVHNLQIYYMERVGGSSNCAMKFNMPVLPKGNMSVAKVEENVNEALTGQEEYEFALLSENDTPKVGEGYKVVDLANSATIARDGVTDANGKFSLRHNEVAVFTGMDVGTNVKVKELSTGHYATSYIVDAGEKVSGKETSVNQVKDDYPNFVFYNAWETSSIKVEKQVIDEDSLLAEAAEFDLSLSIGPDGNLKPYSGAATGSAFDAGALKLKDDGTTIISGVPVGWLFTLSENAPTLSETYTFKKPLFNGIEGEFGTAQSYTVASATNSIIVTNTCIPIPKFADLTIVKTGIENLDNHAANSPIGNEEHQSTIYTVSGTGSDGSVISIEVVAHGNDSVTIKNLPLGAYTVTEEVSWSWRYDFNSATASKDNKFQSITNGISFTLTGDGETVTFDNDRSRVKWLSGDNYETNVFAAFDVSN